MTDSLSMQIDHSRRFERSMEIVRLYADGVPVDVIAREFECSRSTVMRLARAAGLPKRPKNKFPEKTRQDAIAMLEAGILQATIAKELGVSVSWVSVLGKAVGLNRYGG